MISIDFPNAGVLCKVRFGTAICQCVLPVFHEVVDKEPHICLCGSSWDTTRMKDKWNTNKIVTNVYFERDKNHPHYEFDEVDYVETETFEDIFNENIDSIDKINDLVEFLEE